MVLDRYIGLAKNLGLLLIMYTVCRIAFFLVNYAYFSEATSLSVVLAFLYGMRFDLSIIFSSNLLFIALYLFPTNKVMTRAFQGFMKCFFVFLNALLLLMNLADVQYFKFTSKRTGYDVLGILGDVYMQSLQLFFHYWYLPFFAVLLGLCLFYFYTPTEKKGGQNSKFLLSTVFYGLFIGFSIMLIRGGFQYKPLKPDHAFVLKPNRLGNLVLNTPYNFFTTLSFPTVQQFTFFKSYEEVTKVFLKTKKETTINNSTKANIVILIMESFSREYMGIGSEVSYTPFLDSLARAGVFFDHHYANGRRSIEAVPAIIASIPNLMDEPYITGSYQTNELHGLPERLAKAGYYSAFFHGGRNGTMGFDKFCSNAGFLDYFGLDEYPTIERDYDGNWGIFDEPYFDYFTTSLSGFKQPFLATLFSLSSHQPYTIPSKYKGKFPKGTLEIHESIGYADHSLKHFFNQASKTDWYENTLFIITADHSQNLKNTIYLTPTGVYRVPLVLFHPKGLSYVDTSIVSQHLDIAPTVLDYLDLTPFYSSFFGNSLFAKGEGSALLYADNAYFYLKKDYFIEYSNNSTKMYALSDPGQTTAIDSLPHLKREREQQLKAFLQYYSEGLINNSWYKD